MTESVNHQIVSVVMPTFNQAEYIGEAITSVLSQSYSNLELIIIDNYSTDETEDVINSFQDERIKYFKFHNHGVIASSRNYGATKICGEYIAFIDSDDVWEPMKLERQIQHMQDKQIVCVSSACKLIGDTYACGNYLDTVLEGEYRDFGYDGVVLENPVITSSGMVRKDVFLHVGGFDEGKVFRFIEDWEFWLRVAHQGKIRILNEPLIQYRIYYKPDRDLRDVRKRSLKVIEKHHQMGFLSDNIEKVARGNCYISLGRAFLDVGDYKGITYYIKGLFLSRGGNKLRAFAGLMLFLVPSPLRPFAINQACQVKYLFTPKGMRR